MGFDYTIYKTTNQTRKKASFYGKEKDLLLLIANGHSMNSALKEMGYPGAVSHWYRWAKQTINTS